MFNKLQLLLSLNPAHDLQGLLALLDKEGEAMRAFLPEGSRQRRAVRLPGDPTASVPQDGHTPGSAPPPSFDVVVELGGDELGFAVLEAAAAGLAERLEPTIDPALSAAIVGTEHVIIPGSHPLLLVMALRRLPHWSRQEFHDFWISDHGTQVSESVADLQGYRQFHADEDATRRAAKAAGLSIDDLEGTAEGYYQTIDVFLEIMAKPEVAADAGFIDHSRSVMWLYELVD